MNLKEIDYLSHTADVRMRIRTDSVQELFEAALEGMDNIIRKGECERHREPTIIKTIHIKSENLTTLLIEFLGEVLTLSQMCKAVFCTIDTDQLSDQEISGTISGYLVDGFDEDIKAVTYHEADVHRNTSNQYETIIVFDT